MDSPFQPALFEFEPEAPRLTPKRQTGSRRFLSETRERFELLQQSPTLLKAARKAARSTVKAAERTDERAGSQSFEKVLVKEILDNATTIQEELLQIASDAGRTDILGIDFEKGVGVSDLLVIWRLTGRAPLPVAVNVKKLAPGSSKTEGCSLTQFIALATDDFDVRKPPSSISIPTWRWVVEWCADDARKIQPKTDYYLLIGEVADGTLESLHFQGVLSTVKNGRSVARKHPNKDTATFIVGAVDPLPDDVDINRVVSREMLPRPDLDALRALVVSVLSDGKDSDTVVEVSRALLAVSDEELVALVATLVKP